MCTWILRESLTGFFLCLTLGGQTAIASGQPEAGVDGKRMSYQPFSFCFLGLRLRTYDFESLRTGCDVLRIQGFVLFRVLDFRFGAFSAGSGGGGSKPPASGFAYMVLVLLVVLWTAEILHIPIYLPQRP